MAKINSSDISLELAREFGLAKSVAKAYTNYIFNCMCKHLEDNDEVNIKMFGKFKMDITAPRNGRNINTGEHIIIPAKYKIKYEMSRALTARYNQTESDDFEE